MIGSVFDVAVFVYFISQVGFLERSYFLCLRFFLIVLIVLTSSPSFACVTISFCMNVITLYSFESLNWVGFDPTFLCLCKAVYFTVDEHTGTSSHRPTLHLPLKCILGDRIAIRLTT